MIRNITLGKMNNIRKSIILNVLASISNLIPFIALAKIVETLFLNRGADSIDTSLLWKYFGIMAIFFLITFLLENLATKYTYELGYKTSADGRIELADHIRKLPIGYISGKSSAEILDTLMNDFFKVETAVTHQLPQFFSGICVAVLCSILFLIINVKMGIATLIGLPISVLLLTLMQNFQKKIYLKTKKMRIKEEEDINEYLDAIKTLKAYNSLDDTLTKLEEDIDNSRNANYDPNEGTIKIGGVDLLTADPDKLMDKFSVVFQDVYLFKDTIYNNIKFGNEDASKDEIMNAAKMAGAYDFIVKKDDGFDTMIGQGGATLSGGEKQRISIARAILKNAPIILLDEATSSLDPENELIIQEAISNLIKNKTVVVVAHKLRNVMGADKIVVLNKGKVEEVGKHEELIKNEGLYKDLWNYQEKSKEWKIVQ